MRRDGKLAAVLYRGGGVKLFNLQMGKSFKQFDSPEECFKIKFGHKIGTAGLLGQGEFRLFDFNLSETVTSFRA